MIRYDTIELCSIQTVRIVLHSIRDLSIAVLIYDSQIKRKAGLVV